jgi:hypothetical protein
VGTSLYLEVSEGTIVAAALARLIDRLEQGQNQERTWKEAAFLA